MNKLVIENKIIKSRVLSLDSIKRILHVKTNSGVIKTLMQFLEESIKEIGFNTEFPEIVELNKVLRYIKPQNEEEFKIVEENMKIIFRLLSSKIDIFSNGNYIHTVLESLEDSLNLFIVEMRLSILDNQECINKNSNIKLDEKSLKRIVCYVIYESKNAQHLSILLTCYPQITDLKISGDKILLKLIKEYLNNPKLSYLEEPIMILITKSNLTLKEREKALLLIFESPVKFKQRERLFLKEITYKLQGITGNWGERYAMLKKRYGLMEHTDQIPNYRFNLKPVDMTDRNVITIDSEGTCVFDDAFSFKINPNGTYQFGMYFADLSSITPGSQHDIIARSRFETIYLDGFAEQMFPNFITSSVSLSQGFRKALAFTFTLSRDYQILDFDVNLAMIKVKNNMIASNVANILQDSSLEQYHMLKCLLELSDSFLDKNYSIDRYHTIKQIVRELGDACVRVPEVFKDTPGNQIVKATMIFFNSFIANYFDSKKIPFIYRVNEINLDSKIIGAISKYQKSPNLVKFINTYLKYDIESTYSSVNVGHNALGLSAYTRATSPARSYVSLVIQRMIYSLFIEKSGLDSYLEQYADVESRAQEFTKKQDRNKRFLSEYFNLPK